MNFSDFTHFLDSEMQKFWNLKNEYYIYIVVKVPFNLTPYMGFWDFFTIFIPYIFASSQYLCGDPSKYNRILSGKRMDTHVKLHENWLMLSKVAERPAPNR